MIKIAIFKKPTVFYSIGFLAIIIGIPLGIHAFTQEGFKAILGFIIFMYVIAAGILIFFDRLLVKRISLLKINIIELFISFVVIFFYLYTKSNLIVNITNENIEYLLVIENPGNLENDKLDNFIPMNMSINTDKNYVIVDKMPNEVEYSTSAAWDGVFYYNTFEFEKYQKVKLYSKNKMVITEEFIDSLIANE